MSSISTGRLLPSIEDVSTGRREEAPAERIHVPTPPRGRTLAIDLLAVVAGVVLAILGWSTGAVAQCLRIVFVVAAVVLSVPVAGWAQRLLRPEGGFSHPIVEGGLIVAAGIVVYVVLAVLGWFFVRTMWVASDSLTLLDRIGGAALGLLKTVILAFFLVSVVSLMRAPLEEFDEEDRLHLRDGYLSGFVREYNLLVAWRFAALDRLRHALAVYAVARRRDAYQRVRSKYPRAADFFRRPDARELTGRARLLEAAVDDRFDVLLADSVVRRHLGKPEFVGALGKVDWESLLEDLRGGEEKASRRFTPRRFGRQFVSLPVRTPPASRRGSRKTG